MSARDRIARPFAVRVTTVAAIALLTLGGFAPAAGARRYGDLPAEAQRYIARLEEITGVPAAIISTGSAREDTIIREDSVAGKWFRSA